MRWSIKIAALKNLEKSNKWTPPMESTFKNGLIAVVSPDYYTKILKPAIL